MPDTQIIASCPARVTVPAWTTVDYHDKDGNHVAKFDAPRPYSKDCLFDHDNAGAPFTATFTSVKPDAVHVDEDQFPAGV
jgi:hypothetical protein